MTFSTTRQRLYVILGLVAVVAAIALFFVIQSRGDGSDDNANLTATASASGLEVPNPAACVVDPRSIANMTQLASGPLTGTITPIAETIAAATPIQSVSADPATMSNVLNLIRQSIACRNAGDYARAFALYTDEYAQALLLGAIVGSGVDATQAITAISTPRPQPSYTWKGISAFGQVEMLSPDLSATLVIGQSANPGSTSIETIERFWIINDNGVLRIAGIEDLTPSNDATPSTTGTPAA